MSFSFFRFLKQHLFHQEPGISNSFKNIHLSLYSRFCHSNTESQNLCIFNQEKFISHIFFSVVQYRGFCSSQSLGAKPDGGFILACFHDFYAQGKGMATKNWPIELSISSYILLHKESSVATPNFKGWGKCKFTVCLGEGELDMLVKGLMATTVHLLVAIYSVYFLCPRETTQKSPSPGTPSSELRVSEGCSAVSVSGLDVALLSQRSVNWKMCYILSMHSLHKLQ